METMFLKCKKCNSIWQIKTVKSSMNIEYPLCCPYCPSSGIYEVFEIDEKDVKNIEKDEL